MIILSLMIIQALNSQDGTTGSVEQQFQDVPLEKQFFDLAEVSDVEHQAFISKRCFFKRGLTWGLKTHDCKHNTDLVSCHGAPPAPTVTGSCNPYSGDTRCLFRRPILCIHKNPSLPRPPTFVGTCTGCAIPDPAFYYGWSRGFIRETPPIMGCRIGSKQEADRICQKYFGCGYQMASHHDGVYTSGMTTSSPIYGGWLTTFPKYGGGW